VTELAGSARGVQTVIRQSYPAACYTHCAAHALNLTISKASEIQAIRNAFGAICETVTFFRLSPKRSTQLEHRIVHGQSNDDPRVKSQKTHLKKTMQHVVCRKTRSCEDLHVVVLAGC